MQAVIHSTVSPTVTRLPATWLGMSMQNLSSQDIMISTMSRLSAPRSAVNLAASVSRSSSHPKWNTRMSLSSSAKSLTTRSRTVPPQAQCGRMMAFKVAARPVSKLRTHTKPCSGDFSVTPGQGPVGRVLANAAPTVASVATVAGARYQAASKSEMPQRCQLCRDRAKAAALASLGRLALAAFTPARNCPLA